MNPKIALAVLVMSSCIGISCPVDAANASKTLGKRYQQVQARSPVARNRKTTQAPVSDPLCSLVDSWWEHKRMPLRVYFEPVAKGVWRYKPHYPKVMKKAFQDWTDATHQYVQFQFIDAKPADITVVYVNDTARKKDGLCRVKYRDGGSVRAALIELALMKDAPDEDVLHTGQHEIGHALGLVHTNHKGVMRAKGTYPLEFISDEDCNDLKRNYRLDNEYHPLILTADDMEKYRISMEQAIRKYYKTPNATPNSLDASTPAECECEFSFEVDSSGHIYNHQANKDSPLQGDLLLTLTRAEPLPKPPSRFCEHLRVKGVASASGRLEVRELQPCN